MGSQRERACQGCEETTLTPVQERSGKRLVSAKSYKKLRHVLVFVDEARRRSGLGAAGTVGARRNRPIRESEPPVVVCRDNSALVVEREVLRMGIELLAVLLLTEVSLVHSEIENSG